MGEDKQITVIDIKRSLKDKGYRASGNRDNILQVLDKAEKPLTLNEIHERALALDSENSEQEVNHSTVYRTIESLAKEGFIKVISLLEGHNRYELERGDHHHHLVCTECSEILPVHIGEHLEETEKNIEQTTGYKRTSHSLEFFGICTKCAN
ncbi:MAG: Fur family transcriptional regulator [Candidatus Dojkabacteria bacterium]